MRAVVLHRTGGAEVLRVEQVPEPTPGPGEVRVRIEAAGVNFIDIYHRSGLYPLTLPAIPGQEGAGTVEAIGPQVAGLVPGDRVAWAGPPGAYAEKACLPAERLVPLPAGLSFTQGAAAMLQGMTAHYLARSTFSLDARHSCLVHAAAGGVGLLLCQMARQAGARVLATVSGPEKARLAREAGADETIDYSREDFAAACRRLTDGRGVDVVYDSVGQATFSGSLDALARRGLLVLFGQSSGPVSPFDLQLLHRKGSLYLTRPGLFHYVHGRAELLERAAAVLGAVADGSLRLRIDSELGLEQAADAHRRLESRQSSGKLLLRP